jgi:hypothetical protein
MHRGKPVTTMPSGAVPGNRPGLRVFLFILGALLLGSCALAAPGAKPADKQVKQPAASDFVGSETCATCHENVSKSSRITRTPRWQWFTARAASPARTATGLEKSMLMVAETRRRFRPAAFVRRDAVIWL